MTVRDLTPGYDTFIGGDDAADIVRTTIANLDPTDKLYGGSGATTTDILMFTGAAGIIDNSKFDSVSGFERIMLANDASGLNALAITTGMATNHDAPFLTVIGQAAADSIDAGGLVTRISLSGGGGNDVLIGGSMNDTLNAGTDNDVLLGNAGADLLLIDASSFDANDMIDGGEGNDTLVLRGAGTVTAAAFTNVSSIEKLTLTATTGGVSVTLSNSLVAGSSGSSFAVTGSTGDDVIDASGVTSSKPMTISGGNGADVLTAGAGPTVMRGGDDADHLFAGAGNATLYGDAGDDVLTLTDTDMSKFAVYGGDGSDRLVIAAAGTADLNALLVYGGIETVAIGDVALDLTLRNTRTFVELGTDAGAVVHGGSGYDTLVIGADGQLAEGGDGNDEFRIGPSLTGPAVTGAGITLDGGNGTDTLRLLAGTKLDMTLMTVTDIERIADTGSGAGIDLTLDGGGYDVRLTGPGNDTITLAGDILALRTGAGDDEIHVTAELDPATLIYAEGGNDTLFVHLTDGMSFQMPFFTTGVEEVHLIDERTDPDALALFSTNTVANMKVVGTASADNIVMMGASQSLDAGDGDDLIVVTTKRVNGAIIDGGDGIDTLSILPIYASSYDLRVGIVNVERIALIGDVFVAIGDSGYDVDMGDGYSSVIGGAGNDTFRIYYDDQTVKGGAGNDVFYVDYRDFDLSVAPIFGGTGIDTLIVTLFLGADFDSADFVMPNSVELFGGFQVDIGPHYLDVAGFSSFRIFGFDEPLCGCGGPPDVSDIQVSIDNLGADLDAADLFGQVAITTIDASLTITLGGGEHYIDAEALTDGRTLTLTATEDTDSLTQTVIVDLTAGNLDASAIGRAADVMVHTASAATITLGSGDDTIGFADNFTGTLDGGGGNDVLDITGFADLSDAAISNIEAIELGPNAIGQVMAELVSGTDIKLIGTATETLLVDAGDGDPVDLSTLDLSEWGGLVAVINAASTGQTFTGSGGTDYIVGGAGDDSISVTNTEDTVQGGAGADTVDLGDAGGTIIIRAADIGTATFADGAGALVAEADLYLDLGMGARIDLPDYGGTASLPMGDDVWDFSSGSEAYLHSGTYSGSFSTGGSISDTAIADVAALLVGDTAGADTQGYVLFQGDDGQIAIFRVSADSSGDILDTGIQLVGVLNSFMGDPSAVFV